MTFRVALVYEMNVMVGMVKIAFGVWCLVLRKPSLVGSWTIMDNHGDLGARTLTWVGCDVKVCVLSAVCLGLGRFYLISERWMVHTYIESHPILIHIF